MTEPTMPPDKQIAELVEKLPSKEAIASVTAMIRTMDVHNAAIKMAESLKLNAEVTTVVGKWDERGQITGWTKASKTKEPANALVEVFISDVGGASRESRRYLDAIETLLAENLAMRAERDEMRARIINTPETADFMAAVPIEAAHQRERWGVDHDAGKTAFDWFWLIGYLAQKAADASTRGDDEKAKHHTISTAAALANWHAALTGADTRMRPGTHHDIEAARAALGHGGDDGKGEDRG